jgi:hypothetical protein
MQDYGAKDLQHLTCIHTAKCLCKHVRTLDCKKNYNDSKVHHILRLVSTFGFFEVIKLSELLLLDSI